MQVRLVIAASVAILLVTAGITFASDGEGIHACVSTNNGSLRVVNDAAECRTSERALTWGRSGGQSATDVPTMQHISVLDARPGYVSAGGCAAGDDWDPLVCGDSLRPQDALGSFGHAGFTLAPDRYPAGTEWQLEVLMGADYADPDVELCVRLVNLTDGAPVPGSEVCTSGSTVGLGSSTPFALSGDSSVYGLAARLTRPGASCDTDDPFAACEGKVASARLIATW